MRWALLGSTGRLGRAFTRLLIDGDEVVGLARRDAAVVGARRDPVALAVAIDGADVVVDLCGFDAEDADALLRAVATCRQPPPRLVFISSIAERPPRYWADEEDVDAAPPPVDPYGRGKRACRLRLQAGWPRGALSVLLPQLVASDDRDAREGVYLRAATAAGHACLPGTGEQRPCVLWADDAARLAIALVRTRPQLRGPVQLAPLHLRPRLRELIAALLQGAGLPPTIRPHPDPSWRGPHSGVDEHVGTARLASSLPGATTADLVEVHRALGAWLVGR